MSIDIHENIMYNTIHKIQGQESKALKNLIKLNSLF